MVEGAVFASVIQQSRQNPQISTLALDYKHGISFHCYADDSQIYVPLSKKDAFSLRPLLSCLEEIKAWMALNFLNFNEKKTEVMVFGPSRTSHPADLGPLAQYLKPTVSNLGVKMDSDLKLYRQIGAVVKSSFFHLRQLAKVKSLLSQQHLETVIHAFVTSRLDYCTLSWNQPVLPQASPVGPKCCCSSPNWCL